MPNLDLPQPSAADAPAAPVMQPTLVPAERTLSDLYTGSWRRRLASLPSVLGRPVANWAARGRSAVMAGGRHGGTGQDAAHR